MAEYIEREKVLMGLNTLAHYFGCGDEKYGVGRAKQVVEMEPTADVVEVRHGKWVIYEKPYGMGYSIPNYSPTHYCSNCKGLGWKFYKRCPHCGAKMDGKGEG